MSKERLATIEDQPRSASKAKAKQSERAAPHSTFPFNNLDIPQQKEEDYVKLQHELNNQMIAICDGKSSSSYTYADGGKKLMENDLILNSKLNQINLVVK